MTPRHAVIVRPLARRDIAEAAAWYEERTVGLGSRLAAAVDGALAAAGTAPEHSPRVYRDVRRVRVHDFPYAVDFVVRAGTV